jgi:hypothetical protein
MEYLVTMTTQVPEGQLRRPRRTYAPASQGVPAHSRLRGICSASGDRRCNLVHEELWDRSPQMIAAS